MDLKNLVVNPVSNGHFDSCSSLTCRKKPQVYTVRDDHGDLPPVPSCEQEDCQQNAWREAKWIRQEYPEELYPERWVKP
jgi:hypothetical protein